MGFWDDDEIKKRQDESVQRLKDSWGKFEGDLRHRADDERQWYRFLDDVASNPQILETKTDIELDHLRIRAQSEIDSLQRRVQTGQGMTETLSNNMGSNARGSGLASLLTALTGGLTNSIEGHIDKNQRLLQMILAKYARDKKQMPPMSPVQQMQKGLLEKEASRQETITMLEKMRDQQITKYPLQRDSIEKRFRKLIEEVMDQA